MKKKNVEYEGIEYIFMLDDDGVVLIEDQQNSYQSLEKFNIDWIESIVSEMEE